MSTTITTTNCPNALPEWERELLGIACCGDDHADQALTELRQRLTPVIHADMVVNTTEAKPRKKAAQRIVASPGEIRFAGNAKRRRKNHEARIFCEMVRVSVLAKATNRRRDGSGTAGQR